MAIAATTSRSRLGIMVTGITHRNPGLVAKMAATLDHISDGRAILGLGAAWNEAEHKAYGITFPPAAERLALLEESCVVIRSLFGDAMTTFDLLPNRALAAPSRPEFAPLAAVSMEWSAATRSSSIFYARQDFSDLPVKDCVGMPRRP